MSESFPRRARAIAFIPVLAMLGGCPGGNGNGDDSPPPQPPSPPDPITMISKDANGFAGNSFSQGGAASADGRYVAIDSSASNLVPNDTNNTNDVFLHDTESGTTTRVSLAHNGDEADDDVWDVAISADGRVVGFDSRATNLVPGDTNMMADVFVHDTQTDTTTRVSVDSAGNEADGDSFVVSLSADGRIAAFQSRATNLVVGDTNMMSDVFVRDLQAGTTTRVSVDSNGNQGDSFSIDPVISADGRFVAFASGATNLVVDDTNNEVDIFLHDRQTGATTRVSVDSNRVEGNGFSRAPEISADGRFVAWYGAATNLVSSDNNGVDDIFLHDTQTGITSRISVATDGTEGDDASDTLAVSEDGRYVGFYSDATNLVAGDMNSEADTFVRDTQQNITYRVSVAADGTEANAFSQITGMTADGRYVLFYSPATNLLPAASNMQNQLFRAPNTPP